jgi:DNA-binding transcriptional regulator LsrR (DeoR family)
MKNGSSSLKQEEKLDLAARAAWLYYVAGNTQQEIATKLKISRPAAQRLVAVALQRGIVKVQVHHKINNCLEVGAALRERYDLVVCEVVPSDEDSRDQVLRKIAVAGAQIMGGYLSEQQPQIIALSTGRTMKSVVDELPALVRTQHRLVSLVGAIAHDGSSNRYDVALRTAEKTSSKYYLLPSPFLADSAEERRQWCRHRLYRAVETLAGQADVAFFGIGEIGLGCPMHRDGFINELEVNELVESGAVGEILGWAFNRAGESVRTSIDERVTSIQLRRPPKKPIIAFAAGELKTAAILGALRGRWINGLVTDETCGQLILRSGE